MLLQHHCSLAAPSSLISGDTGPRTDAMRIFQVFNGTLKKRINYADSMLEETVRVLNSRTIGPYQTCRHHISLRKN